MIERLRTLTWWQTGILLLAFILLYLGASTYPYWYWRLTGSGPTAAEAAPATAPTDEITSDDGEFTFLADYRAPESEILGGGTTEQPLWQTALTVVASLAGILMIVYGGTWALREILSPTGGSPFRGGKRGLVNVQEVIPLSPKHSIYVVRAGEKLLLLGATENEVSYLAELDEETIAETFAEPLEEAQEMPQREPFAPAPSIAALLAEARAKVAAARRERPPTRTMPAQPPRPAVESIERLV